MLLASGKSCDVAIVKWGLTGTKGEIAVLRSWQYSSRVIVCFFKGKSSPSSQPFSPWLSETIPLSLTSMNTSSGWPRHHSGLCLLLPLSSGYFSPDVALIFPKPVTRVQHNPPGIQDIPGIQDTFGDWHLQSFFIKPSFFILNGQELN